MKKIFILTTFTYLFMFPSYIYADTAIDSGINYLKSKQESSGKITGGFSAPSQWSAIALTANGLDISTVKNPTNSLKDFLSTDIPSNNTATEWENRLLAIVAFGESPINFGGTNYVQKVEGFYTNGQIGDTCALNDDIFGLLSLIVSGNSANSQIKQDILDYLISKQDPNGGFGWSAPGCAWYETAPDMTAAAIQALKAAKDNGLTNSNLDNSITNAKTYLLSTKNGDGGFGYFGSSDTDTTGWALMALNVLGEQSSTDAINAKNYLLSKQSSADGGFQSFDWGSSTFVSNSTTTAQTLIALSGKGWVLQIFSTSVTSTPSPTPTLIPTPTSPTTIAPADLKNLFSNGYFSLPSTATISATPSITTAQKITINVSSGSGTNSVILPQGVIIRRADGANIDINVLSSESLSVGSLSGLGSSITIDGAFQWGIPNVSLEFTTPITIDIFVGTSLNGQTLNIQRSPSNSSGWTTDGIVAPKTCVVTNGICSFQTIKASYFAATRTAASSSTSSSSGSSTTPSPTPTPSPSSSPTPAASSVSSEKEQLEESAIPSAIPEVLGITKENADKTYFQQNNKKAFFSVLSIASFAAATVYWKFKLNK